MYIQLNSQIIRYEKIGEGLPVILLHPVGKNISVFEALAKKMSRNHTVFLMDLRGHGESATPKNYHFADMASDVINLIIAQEIEKPAIVGVLEGAVVALTVALQRSDLISSLVLSHSYLSVDGLSHRRHHELKKQYKSTGDLRVQLCLNEPAISASDLKNISVKTLIFAGKGDIIKPKETQKILSGIRAATQQELSGAILDSIVEQPEIMADYIEGFI